MKALKVVIGANTKGFNSAVSGASGRMDHFAKKSKAALLGIAGATAGLTAAFAKWADELDNTAKLAQRFGATAEEMQRLGFIANKSGASVEEIADALKDSSIKAEEAMRGSKAAQDGFDAMGISAEKFINLGAQEKILALAEGFQKAEKSGLGYSSAQTIIGGSAMKLLPLMRQTTEELKRQGDEANVVSNSTVKNIERMNDTFKELKNRLSGWAGEAVRTLSAFGISIVAFTKKTVQRIGSMFDLLADSAKTTAKLVQAVFLSDFKGAKAAYAELGKIVDNADKKLEKQLAKIDKARDLSLIDLYVDKDIKKPKIDFKPPPVELETPTELLEAMKNLGSTIMDSLKGSLKPSEAKKKEEAKTAATFSAITAKRGQSISSLASHGGGRGMKGAMSGLTKVALESQRVLERIAMNTGKPLQTVLS